RELDEPEVLPLRVRRQRPGESAEKQAAQVFQKSPPCRREKRVPQPRGLHELARVHAKKREIKRKIGGKQEESQHIDVIQPIAERGIEDEAEQEKAFEGLSGAFILQAAERGNESDERQRP